ncbi:MAG: hypothetical protein IJX99_10085 [Clostridia bacterium]|nr:hypothetical protein [Clostridia bacterium]
MSDNNKYNCTNPAPAPICPVVIVENPAEKVTDPIHPSIKAYREKFPNRNYWRPPIDVYSRDGFTVIGRDT